ncbi:MAG: UDP-N-acetylmuramoyl-L-alanyl-D-glutamate--2,6-diaminopimelate ligase [Saccharofermentanales bacterium]
MKLVQLLEGLSDYSASGDIDVEITNIAYDSRKVRQGSLFVCIDGFVSDGHRYIGQAMEAGAAAVMIQNGAFPEGVVSVRVPDSRKGLAHVSAAFFGWPARRLSIVGITGTKGKTTAAFMTDAIFSAAGIDNALIGTIYNKIGNDIVYASRTTPESFELQALLDSCVSRGIGSCVMEVSSQGLALHRVYGCRFETGVYTNLYNDHIGPAEHADMEDYMNAKSLLFDMVDNAVVNIDADYASNMIRRASANAGTKIWTLGIRSDAMVRASGIVNVSSKDRIGTSFDLASPWYTGTVFVALPGLFNVYNALCAIACAGIRGVNFDSVVAGLSQVTIKGRVQPVKTGRDFQVIVDYAHNAASLENLLTTMREYVGRRLVCVFGCGGDRAKSRRYEMGETSGRLADFTVITSDNPRTEDPEAILADIETGLKKTAGRYIRITDRTQAIRAAIQNAQSGDIIIIAGKGHETYQIFADKTIHYDDFEIATEILKELDVI